jgi:hypothetical protein
MYEEKIDFMNKLFCTFSTPEHLPDTLDQIQKHYTVLYKKIFVLKSPDCAEYLCTYNIDTANANGILENTILLHRKKHFNTLYTINALNLLIKQLNNGYLDTQFPIPWSDYQNTVLLTQDSGLRKLTTEIHTVISVI